MLGTVFHWIYCLKPVLLIFLLAGFTVAFAFVYHKNQHRKYCKPVIGMLLLGAITVILAATLLNRTERGEGLAPSWIPFASYIKVMQGENPELLRSCFMNVALFYPAGLLGTVLLPRKWHSVLRILLTGLIFLLMSTGIEFAQYIFVLGYPEVDNIIHNALGAVIGGVCGNMITSTKARTS
ncbi:MAG: VanZ family protein [Clostridia bacterium]|nr:VanZ family protein [Clostridia bacterium]